MADVIRLTNELPCAVCPECGCAAWHIELRGYNMDTDNITAFECCDCGYRIEIVESEEEVTYFEPESEDI
jgi:hypothetical protein